MSALDAVEIVTDLLQTVIDHSDVKTIDGHEVSFTAVWGETDGVLLVTLWDDEQEEPVEVGEFTVTVTAGDRS